MILNRILILTAGKDPAIMTNFADGAISFERHVHADNIKDLSFGYIILNNTWYSKDSDED